MISLKNNAIHILEVNHRRKQLNVFLTGRVSILFICNSNLGCIKIKTKHKPADLAGFGRSLQKVNSRVSVASVMKIIQTAYQADPNALESQNDESSWHRGRSL